MQAIRTKYLCPTDTKGARIKAECDRGSTIIPWDHALNPEDNHREAVAALCDRFIHEDAKQYGTPLDKNPWGHQMAHGQLSDGTWVHVFVEG